MDRVTVQDKYDEWMELQQKFIQKRRQFLKEHRYSRLWFPGTPGTTEGHELFICPTCSALVKDVYAHQSWHDSKGDKQ